MDHLLSLVATSLRKSDLLRVGAELGLSHVKASNIVQENRFTYDGAFSILRIASQNFPTETDFLNELIKCFNNIGRIDILNATNSLILEIKSFAPPIEQTFNSLITSSLMEKISSLLPINKKMERSSIFIVSVEIFSEDLPHTKISCDDLPYLIALYSGIPLNSVLGWPGCPSPSVLQSSYDTYNIELELCQKELKLLDECGLFIAATLPDSFINVRRILAKYYSLINLILDHDKLNLKDLAKRDINALVILYHLLMRCGSNTSFIMRKDHNPKPPAYLIYNITNIPIGVVKKDHINIIKDVIRTDESCITEQVLYPCPF